MTDQRLSEAVELLRTGDRRRARRLLGQIVNEDAENVAAWWYLSVVVEDTAQKIECLKHVLELRPEHSEATQLINKLERRSVTVTPPQASNRPYIDAIEDSEDNSTTLAQDVEETQVVASDSAVVGVAILIAVVAIIATFVVIRSGQSEGVLGIRNPDIAPTQIQLSFGIPACSVTANAGSSIVFINNSSASIRVSKGSEGQEVHMIDLEPGEQSPVAASAGTPSRFAVVALTGEFSAGGAIIEVPAYSVCRVPIQ